MTQITLQFLYQAADTRAAVFPAPVVVDGGIAIRSQDEFEIFRSDLTNISRRILIVGSEAEALAVHRSMADDVHDAVATKLTDDAWALSVSLAGDYDSGVPFIQDLRQAGEPLTIEGGWVEILREDAMPRLLEATEPAGEPSLA